MKEEVKLSALFVLLAISLSLVFIYPIIVQNNDLSSGAKFCGVWGTMISFVSILCFIFKEKKEETAEVKTEVKID